MLMSWNSIPNSRLLMVIRRLVINQPQLLYAVGSYYKHGSISQLKQSRLSFRPFRHITTNLLCLVNR